MVKRGEKKINGDKYFELVGIFFKFISGYWTGEKRKCAFLLRERKRRETKMLNKKRKQSYWIDHWRVSGKMQ